MQAPMRGAERVSSRAWQASTGDPALAACVPGRVIAVRRSGTRLRNAHEGDGHACDDVSQHAAFGRVVRGHFGSPRGPALRRRADDGHGARRASTRAALRCGRAARARPPGRAGQPPAVHRSARRQRHASAGRRGAYMLSLALFQWRVPPPLERHASAATGADDGTAPVVIGTRLSAALERWWASSGPLRGRAGPACLAHKEQRRLGRCSRFHWPS